MRPSGGLIPDGFFPAKFKHPLYSQRCPNCRPDVLQTIHPHQVVPVAMCFKKENVVTDASKPSQNSLALSSSLITEVLGIAHETTVLSCVQDVFMQRSMRAIILHFTLAISQAGVVTVEMQNHGEYDQIVPTIHLSNLTNRIMVLLTWPRYLMCGHQINMRHGDLFQSISENQWHTLLLMFSTIY